MAYGERPSAANSNGADPLAAHDMSPGEMEVGGRNEEPKLATAKPVIHAHPALLKWTPRNHTLKPLQLEALSAISDTFVPSLPPPFEDGENYEPVCKGVTAEDVARFYKLKSSDEDVVDSVRFILHHNMHREFHGIEQMLDSEELVLLNSLNYLELD